MSSYGNVPDEDVKAVAGATQFAAKIAAGLTDAPASWRDIAFELALDGILKDWVDNGTNDLSDVDEADISNLLRLAIHLALQQPESRQEVAFRTIGRNVMQDWVDNWNSDDEDDDEDEE
jgi:hypothetical protein